VFVTRGSESHLIVPQSNTCVSTSAGVTNRRPAISAIAAPSAAKRQTLEAFHLLGYSAFNWETLHAGRTKESGNALRPFEYVCDVLRLGDRAAMTEHKNFRINRNGCFADGLNPGDRFFKCQAGCCANRPLGCQSHMRDDKVGASPCHGLRILFVKNIR